MIQLVLLPGLDGSGLLFEAMRRELPRELGVIVMEYPSSQPLDYRELENLVIGQLPAAGELVLLGESFSGPIATAIAARLPERVVGLVLCCSFIRNPRPILALLSPLVALASYLPWTTRLASGLLLGRTPPPGLRSQQLGVIRRIAPAVLRQRIGSIIAADADAALRSLKAPVLYLQAESDHLVPARAARLAQIACPGLQLLRIRGPHALLQVAPAATAAAVAAFIQGIEHGSQLAAT